ncbi:MAG: cation transporter dimerization domain-containing protein [Pseudomonas sp.]
MPSPTVSPAAPSTALLRPQTLLRLAVAANIVREGARPVWRASQGLMDQALEPAQRDAIQGVLDRFAAQVPEGDALRFDDIATRRSGKRRFADIHMHAPGHWMLQRAAGLLDRLEQALMDAVPGLRATTRLLPLTMEARAVRMDEGAPPPAGAVEGPRG